MFTLLFVLVGLLIFYLLVIFLSSKDDTPADTPAPCRPFSQPSFLDQQLHTSGPTIGWAVQAASVHISSSLSRSVPGEDSRPGKFNFGVGMRGETNLVDMEVCRRLDRCLGRMWSLHCRCH